MRTLRELWLAPCSLLLSLSPLAAGAGEEYLEMSLEQLLEVQVFEAASLQPVPLLRAPGTVYSFDRETIRDLGVRRLADLLELVPGVQLKQYRKRHRSIWARGAIDRYNDKVVLVVDVIPRRHAYYGHFSAEDDLSLEPVERVEVILGPASTLYGSNAAGAVISITTVAAARSGVSEVGVEVGDHERLRGYYLDDRERWSVFASYTDQLAPYDEDRRTLLGQDPVQPLDESYLEFSASYRPTDELTLGVDYRRSEYPFVFIVNFIDIDIREEPLTVRGDYRHAFDDGSRLEARAWYTWDRWQELETDNATLATITEVQDATLGGVKVNYFRTIGDHALLAGFSHQSEEDDGMRFGAAPLLADPGVSNRETGVLLQDIWTVNPNLSLTLGLRYDDLSRFDDSLSYRAAAVYALDERNVFKLMRGTGIRTPTFREDQKVLEGTTFVPPQVQPEELVTTEIGYHHHRGDWALDLTIFQSEFDGYITDTDTPDLADEYFFNSPQPWRMRGAELRGEWRSSREVRVHWAISGLHVSERSDTLQFPTASWTAALGTVVPIAGTHRMALMGTYNSDRMDYNDAIFPDDDPDHFLRLDLSFHGELRPGLSYRAGVYDLLGGNTYDPPGDFSTSRHNNERPETQIFAGLVWELR